MHTQIKALMFYFMDCARANIKTTNVQISTMFRKKEGKATKMKKGLHVPDAKQVWMR